MMSHDSRHSGAQVKGQCGVTPPPRACLMEDVNSLSGTSFLSGDLSFAVARYSIIPPKLVHVFAPASALMWPRLPLMSQPTDARHFPFNCCLIMNTPKKEIHLLLRLQENLLF